ncbi:MAG: FAD-dependent oxidoreductase [Clostridia bacterium]|nr:FAD-dependent oxidoreductase [Clostridia bacterium]
MESVWQKDISPVEFEALDGNKSTDVLIAGGGIAGLLCAYKLKKAGVDCILVEAQRICGGVTGYTTAKITLGHGLIYDKMMKRFGEHGAKMYLDAQLGAIEEYEQLCQKVDCDFEHRDSYVYSLCDCEKIKKEIEALGRLGVEAELSDARELPIDVAGAVRVKNQAQFHPLKFLYGISKELPVYENTKVLEFYPYRALTNHGVINFKKLIVATHFPIFNKHGGYSLKLYQHRSYVIALKGAQTVEGMYVDESDIGMSFRTYGDILLLGGGGHRTGKQGGCWQELEMFAKSHYKGASIVGKWATQDCMTLDDIPYIGQYSRATPDVYVATGFNKWGMTNAMVASTLICDLVVGRKNPYEEIFMPSRSSLRPQLLANTFESMVGILTPTMPRCPHLGCALKYNRAEHTWDCPCHGSRFTEDGKLINNPATDDKQF